MTEVITAAEEIEGGTRLTISRTGVGEGEDAIDVTAGGVTFRTACGAETDIPIIRFPLEAGGAWAYLWRALDGLIDLSPTFLLFSRNAAGEALSGTSNHSLFSACCLPRAGLSLVFCSAVALSSSWSGTVVSSKA